MPMIALQSVVLPMPLRPTIASEPRSMREAQAVEDARLAVERVEARDLEQRRRRGGSDGDGDGLAHRRPR